MQSRRASMAESAVNIAVGVVVAWGLTYGVLPWWGLEPSASQAVEITALYTAASAVRSYLIRRAFNGRGR